MERTYFAVVFGLPANAEGCVDANIGRSPYDRKKMAVLVNGGKRAVTHFKVMENFGGVASLIKCNLETGRTHQIRVHMAKLGHNLLGDKVYTKAKKVNKASLSDEMKKYIYDFPRHALHAQSLGFVHPSTKEKMFFDSPIPDDMQELIERLRKI